MKETIIQALRTAIERLESGKWYVTGASIDVDDTDLTKTEPESYGYSITTREKQRMSIELELFEK